MLPTGSRTQQTSSAYAAATSADHELLVEFELFDAQGRWNPRNIIFYTKDDSTREKKLSTRCFRGLMAWYGKLWAKNYLSRHFKDKPESNALLQQIKRSDFVNYKAFEETVARCTLLYSDLQQVAASNTSVSSSNVITPSIKGIDKVVLQYFMKIDWRAWKDESQFKCLTLTAALNIKNMLQKLKVDQCNDDFVDQLADMVERYNQWVESLKSETDKSEINLEGEKKFLIEKIKILEEIGTTIATQITDYREKRGVKQPIASLIDAVEKDKNYWISKNLGNVSFSGHLENCGLLDYLRRGKAGFIENVDLKEAERILDLDDNTLRTLARFLDDGEFTLLKNRFDQLKKELPQIKLELADRELCKANKLVNESG